jgi:hypothetical protein
LSEGPAAQAQRSKGDHQSLEAFSPPHHFLTRHSG